MGKGKREMVGKASDRTGQTTSRGIETAPLLVSDGPPLPEMYYQEHSKNCQTIDMMAPGHNFGSAVRKS